MLSLRKIFPYRVLIFTLVGKELKTRYRGSAMGLLWSLLNPLFMMLVYTLVFSVYIRIDMKNYAVFLFAGLLPWLWISTSLSQSTVAIVREGHLLKKVSFPSEILPFVSVSSAFINFLLSLPLYFAFCLFYRVKVGWPLFFLPVLFLLAFFFQYGLSLLLAATNVSFRDVEHLTANILTFLFFLTPILYTVDLIPVRFRSLALANPLAALILSFQDVLFYNRFPQLWQLAVVLAAAISFTVIGEAVFSRLSPGFAEKV